MKHRYSRAAKPQPRSAELDSAVSQNCILRTIRASKAFGSFRRLADFKSAIQQITNLRYTTATNPLSLWRGPSALYHKPILCAAGILSGIAALCLFTGCGKTEAVSTASAGIGHQQVADMLFAVMASDRAVYTKQVVNRLQNEEQVIKASEHWKDEKALPLPAQMFRMGAETVTEKNAGFNYALLSLWPINKQNEPKTDVEKTGLQFVADNGGTTNYYAEEVLGGQKYFTAVYADVAVSPACVKCHNYHDETPRDDFELNDVMGGVVLRIPIN